MPMNPEYKAPWLAALRSGEYQQTKSVLHDGKGYCCLGVLCKVAGSSFYDANTESTDEEPSPSYEPTVINGDAPGSAETLTEHGLHLFGLTDGDQDKLARMNDGDPSGTKWDDESHAYVPKPAQEPKTFAQIADWIEENL